MTVEECRSLGFKETGSPGNIVFKWSNSPKTLTILSRPVIKYTEHTELYLYVEGAYYLLLSDKEVLTLLRWMKHVAKHKIKSKFEEE